MGSKGVITGCLFLLLITSGCKSESDYQKVRPVVTGVAQVQQKRPANVYSGSSKAGKSIKMSFRIGGYIDEVPIRVGEVLKEGQVIAKLRDEDLKLQLDESKATLEQALAESRHATAKYRRTKALFETNSISRNDLDSARASHEAALAAVNRVEAAVNLAERQLQYATLLSEVEQCTVSAVNVEENENINPGEIVAEVICGESLEVEIGVPETEIAMFSEGDGVFVQFNALPDRFYRGKITEVGVVPSVGTTYPVLILIEETDDDQRPGMAAKVFYYEELGPLERFMEVPFDAVSEDSSGHFVYVFDGTVNGEGVARKRRVIIGEVNPSGIEVISGLEPGEKYIIAGARFLRDGRIVKEMQ